jgi:hypothetical protein
MSRQQLPSRRPSITTDATWHTGEASHRFTVTVGYDDAGQPREVFADNAKGAMAAVISDACVLASLAMQFGATPADLAKSIGRIPAWVNGAEGEQPASPIGVIIATIVEAA